MAYTDYLDTVQKIYSGYYQRPADPEGQIYWAERLDASGGNLNEIIEAFANCPESQALYGTITSSNIGDVVDDIYNAQFGRDAEAGGKAFYVDGFNAGTFTAATIMLNILNGAQNEDRLAIENKVTAADLFTRTIDPELDGRDFLATYSGDADAVQGREALADVTWNPVTIPTQSEMTEFIQNNIADPGDPILTVIGKTFTLTTGADNFAGGSDNDTFVGTYDAAVTDTFSATDILAGGTGTADTLDIAHLLDVAITPPDALWTGITGIEKIVINTTGDGAQTITTGAAFETAFASAGVDLTTTTSGAGAINVTMTSFTGAATLTTTSTDGAQTITTGSGLTTVNAESGAGALTITGANLATVDAITTGAGAQTITSTGAGAVTVTATSDAGATTITTGAGNDTITLYASAAAGANSITGGAGADIITLVTGINAATDTIVQADGASIVSTADTTTGAIAAGQTITFGNGLDIITGFAGATDVLNVGTGGAAISGIGMNEAAFTATQTIFLSGAYDAGTGVFTIAADGAGADTLLLDTTAAADQDIATADTWVLLVGTNSADLIAGSFTPPVQTFALTASAASVDEGNTVNFTLDTTNVAVGSQYSYVISGVNTADVVGGSLTGTATVGSDGKAVIAVGLVADATTEGAETLTMTVASQVASVTVADTSTDTSTTPPVQTFALTASAASVDEGNTVNFTLDTTNVAVGSQCSYVISGVNTADVVGGSLTGTATVGSDGKAVIAVGLVADATTEGNETLTMTVAGQSDSVTVVDTSTTPPDQTFTLTTGADNFIGGSGNDTFVGTYDDGSTGTWGVTGVTDTLNGNGGTDTLNITIGAVAINPADTVFNGITDIDKIVFDTTGVGAQTITTGANFNTAFAGGVDLTAQTLEGAITIDLSGVPTGQVVFDGTATLTTVTIGAGAHTITTGSATTTVTATSLAAGAQTIRGQGLTTVEATINGAGDQIIGGAADNQGTNLVTVTATVLGAGSQTITSTSGSAVTVDARADEGAQTIVTAGGADTVTLTTAAGQDTTITTNAGNDTIVASLGTDLITGGLGADKMTGGGAVDTFAFGTDGSVLGTSMDIITDFNTAVADVLTFGAATAVLVADATALVAGVNVQTSAGGLITFHTDDNTFAEKIVAVQADAELDAAGSVAMFVDSGNTYVYYAGTATGAADDQLIQLTGINTLVTITGGETTTIA